MANHTVEVNGSHEVEREPMKAIQPTGDHLSMPMKGYALTNGKIRHTENTSDFRSTQSMSFVVRPCTAPLADFTR